MNTLITGATGLVGRALTEHLAARGRVVWRLTRRPRQANDLAWNPEEGQIDLPRDLTFGEVVHLAGENIAAGRWTVRRKEQVLASRVQGTRLLCQALARRASKPTVLISSSAIGYYPPGDGPPHAEGAAPGGGFLAHVCQEWEAATGEAAQAGIRVVHLRIGIVLSRQGGALAKMLPAFRWGLGGRLGSGRQRMSWIALDDLVSAIGFCLDQESLAGVVNAVAPEPASNAAFTRALGQVLHRPTLFPVPAWALRLALGEMAEALLLADLAVRPQRLQEAGFSFAYPDLEQALRRALA